MALPIVLVLVSLLIVLAVVGSWQHRKEQQRLEVEARLGALVASWREISREVEEFAAALSAAADALGEWWEASGLSEIDWEELNQTIEDVRDRS